MNPTSAIAQMIHVEGNFAYVALSQGYEAIIDAADIHLVAGMRWHARVDRRADGSIKGIYAGHTHYRSGMTQKTVMMHQLIAGLGDVLVDHADGNGLNNRRSNLSPATVAENNRNAARRVDNTSGFKGVTWHSQRNKWRAQITAGGKQRSLGLFATPEEAAFAYAKASEQLHGEFGRVA